MVPVDYYVALSAILFSIGALGVLVRRNPLVIFMSIELMLNASNLAMVAFTRVYLVLEGQIFVFFVMTVAAAEVAVGLALIVAIFRTAPQHQCGPDEHTERMTGRDPYDGRSSQSPIGCRPLLTSLETAMHLNEASNIGFFFLAPWVVFFPLIGLLINLAFGHRFSEKVIGTVASAASGLTFVVSVLLAYSLTGHLEAVRWSLGEWIHVGTLQIDWVFRVDTLSTTMMLVVSLVGTLIHIYAIGYMHEDVRFKGDPRRFQRFFVFFNLFIVMMMLLVSGDSYLMLFVGWEGVGLCSFLLIGFWYEMDTLGRPSWANSDAAKKAMIANRIGDFGFLIAAFLMFWGFGSLQFDGVFNAVRVSAAADSPFLILITLFLLLGVTGKSAQIPLYVWLPDAMAGPTPVSALIHAATMVTAGVYLVARSAPLYTAAPTAQFIVALLGAITALFAATIAVGQFDIKKVLAYSTISQLGFMVAGVGMGAFAAGMFHLVTHAFFKALLFLGAGSVILGIERGHHDLAHGRNAHTGREREAEVFDPNDMRNMGGLRYTMPKTFWVYLIGALALAGIPPFAGFWSKDEILAEAFRGGYAVVYWLLAIAAFFTAFYMGRQIWLVFFGKPRHEAAARAEEVRRLSPFR